MSGKPWLKHYGNDIAAFSQIDDLSLTDVLKQAVQAFGDDPSLSFYGKTWTFKEVYGLSEQFARSLYGEGVRKGDRVAVMLPNTPQYVFTLFGTFRTGGIITQVNPMYVEREIEHILKDSDSEVMVVLDALYPRVKKVRHLTSLRKVIVVSLGEDVALDEGDVLFDDFMKTHTSEVPDPEIDPNEDVAVLQYTGGTTGLSKGVMLTHRNLVANLEQTYDFMFTKYIHEFSKLLFFNFRKHISHFIEKSIRLPSEFMRNHMSAKKGCDDVHSMFFFQLICNSELLHLRFIIKSVTAFRFHCCNPVGHHSIKMKFCF